KKFSIFVDQIQTNFANLDVQKLMLPVKLDKNYFSLYLRFRVNERELFNVIEYNDYEGKPFEYQLIISVRREGWLVGFGWNGRGTGCGILISDDEIDIPLHYVIHNNLLCVKI